MAMTGGERYFRQKECLKARGQRLGTFREWQIDQFD